jgi:hypothetical protein
MTDPKRDLRATLDKVGAITKAVTEASAKVRGDVAAQQIQPVTIGGDGDGGGSDSGAQRQS